MVKEWLWVYWFWVQLLWYPQELKVKYLLQLAPSPSAVEVIYPTTNLPPITFIPTIAPTYPAEDRVHVWFVGSDYNIHSVRTAVQAQLQSLYLRSFEQKPYNYRLDSQYENHYIYRADA